MHDFAELARRLDGACGWDDLVLPAEKLAALREICAHARQRAGAGITVLLSGPSGTGKTMSAMVIARELGLDLYRVDLSQVVSKYIGETERNLARLFERAENTGSILFFDEADALFGKRTEVKDSHDRFANLETSYVLQRLEQYRGLAFLSTLRHDLDSAFLRRLDFVVSLSAPEAPERHELWKRVFPAETELATDIDFDSLARSLELTGGQIRKVAISAAARALGESRNVQMADIVHAATHVYEKLDPATEAAR